MPKKQPQYIFHIKVFNGGFIVEEVTANTADSCKRTINKLKNKHKEEWDEMVILRVEKHEYKPGRWSGALVGIEHRT